MKRKTAVLVVDDSAFSRQAIKGMLETDPDIEVVGIATNGVDAMGKVLRLKPDLITLDFEMPEMDGFAFLRWLMKQSPVPTIMVSSYSDTKTVFKALELGAVDFVAKPSRRASSELRNIEKDLLRKVKGISGLNMAVLGRTLQLLKGPSKAPELPPSRGAVEVVTVGASTGGPSALQVVLKELPGDFPAGIVISQHMPKGFTKSFASRLNEVLDVRVREAEEGDEVTAGTVFICPGGHHMAVKRRGKKARIVLKQSGDEDRYVPSIDMMMTSVAETFGKSAMGVLLTGMGRDGREGMIEIKSKGGYTIAESEETSVVFGMPAEAIRAGAALKVLPLQDIAREIIKKVRILEPRGEPSGRG